MSLLEKMRGNTGTWTKVSNLAVGVEIARPRADFDASPEALSSESGDIIWDEIVSITPVGKERVYDIEVEGTHNFVGNGIFAHNTYVLRANTMLAVEGEIHAEDFIVPIGSATGAWATSGTGTTTLMAEIPSAVLTADGKGVDLYKLSTYNLVGMQALAARMNDDEVRVTSLEARVEKLESGAIASASGSPLSLSTTSLASVFEGLSAYIGKGFAQFGSLIADRFVAAANSAGTSSAGTVSMLTGNTVAQVTNAYVTPTTKIFVTFNAPVTGSWYVSDKQAGSFRVVLSVAQTTDVSFDYFLVQTQGQTATSTPEQAVSSTQQAGNSQTAPASSSLPTITLLGDNPLHLSVGGTYVEPGVTIRDSAGGAISTYTTFVNGVQQSDAASAISTATDASYIITYKATDAAGNTGTAVRSIIVGSIPTSSGTSSDSSSSTDRIAPVVTLNGSAALTVLQGGTFTDPGATAVDDVDGAVTPVIGGTVDTAVPGSYTLTYNATDAAGNVGSASRLVTVLASTSAPSEPAPAPAPSDTTTTSDTTSTTTSEPAPAPAPEPEPAPADTSTTTP